MEFASDEYFMREALRQARRAYAADEVPCGAIIVREGEIIARAWNQVEMLKDATAHAEMLAITQAEAVMEDWRLTDCDLYVTKEPCPMCAGAIVHTRLRRVIFGCPDPRGGGAGGLVNILQMSQLNHRCIITSGILADECAALLRDFFRAKREAAEVVKLTTTEREGMREVGQPEVGPQGETSWSERVKGNTEQRLR